MTVGAPGLGADTLGDFGVATPSPNFNKSVRNLSNQLGEVPRSSWSLEFRLRLLTFQTNPSLAFDVG
jgi:hypothetical protein